jgi:hypothetical protein
MNDKAIISFGELTKPATVLIEKISDAVGGLFKPYQIIRVAKAEAEADQIRTESQIQVTDLHKRAMRRFLEEEAKKQSNMECITAKALPLLEEKSLPQNVEDDWITNFFDKSRIVSDTDMQKLWSRVLAGEANAPGTFSKRTVNLLADLDKRDAELFTNLCGFGWVFGNVVPLVFDVQHEFYNRHGINFSTLSHLETLGLIQFDNITGYVSTKLPKSITLSYYGTPVELTLPDYAQNQLSLGRTLLTRAGQELACVCGSKPVEGFFEFVCKRWESHSLIPKRESESGTPTVS